MPCITLALDPLGPIVEIGVSLPGGWPRANPPPPVHWIKAIADTGCTHTSIHTSVAQKLGLTVLSKETSNTPAGVVPINIYHGDLYLRPLIANTPFEWVFNDRRMLELLHKQAAYDALLGMDILSQGAFMVNGLLKNATFCW